METVPISSWSVPKQPPTKCRRVKKLTCQPMVYESHCSGPKWSNECTLLYGNLKHVIFNFKVSNLERKPWHFPKLLFFDHQHSCTRSTGTPQNSRRLSSADSVRIFLLRSRWGLQRQSPLLPFPPWYSCSSETTLALWACGRTWKLSRTATF